MRETLKINPENLAKLTTNRVCENGHTIKKSRPYSWIGGLISSFSSLGGEVRYSYPSAVIRIVSEN